METTKYDTYFSQFTQMMEEETVKITFRRNSFSVSIRKDTEIPEIIEFKNFISNIIGALINNILSGRVSSEYEKYVEMIKLNHSELIEQIKVKLFSNMNTLSDFNFEVINSVPYKNHTFETENTSVIFKVEYDQPITGKDVQQSLTMELSKKNLQDLKNEIEFLLKVLG